MIVNLHSVVNVLFHFVNLDSVAELRNLSMVIFVVFIAVPELSKLADLIKLGINFDIQDINLVALLFLIIELCVFFCDVNM